MSKHELPHHELIARGVIIQDGAVLVNRNTNAKTGAEYCALPGGHVDEGESCPAAIARELEEELGAQVEVGDLCFVAESVYAGRHDWDSRRQEVVLYFWAALKSELKQENGRILSPEEDKNFAWLPLSQLGATNLLPLSFKNWLIQTKAAGNGGFEAGTSSASLGSSTSGLPLYDFHDSTRAAN